MHRKRDKPKRVTIENWRTNTRTFAEPLGLRDVAQVTARSRSGRCLIPSSGNIASDRLNLQKRGGAIWVETGSVWASTTSGPGNTRPCPLWSGFHLSWKHTCLFTETSLPGMSKTSFCHHLDDQMRQELQRQ